MNLTNDIYYNTNYSKLYLSGSYSLFDFEYREDEFILKNIAIKKPITKIGKVDVKGYYDLETPYGYGGFFCNTADRHFIDRGMIAYQKRCLSENIIAEFFSFHPFNDFPLLYPERFDRCFIDRSVVVLDLQKSDDERWLDYASKTRTILRKCNKTLRVEESDDIESFMNIYYETMDKNNARGFYYFEKQYFEDLLNINQVKLIKVLLEKEIIAMSFVMCGTEIAHYHLSANKLDYLKYNANYLILEEAFKLAKQEGCLNFLLGGGRTPSEEDNLFKFKRKFSKLTKDFYLAGSIYNQEIYNQYIEIWENQNPDNQVKYFLKYRLNHG
ncbi:GNAT family N-acetyltransferase [Labilibaculum euxinus]